MGVYIDKPVVLLDAGIPFKTGILRDDARRGAFFIIPNISAIPHPPTRAVGSYMTDKTKTYLNRSEIWNK
jgi:hypothetical protein